MRNVSLIFLFFALSLFMAGCVNEPAKLGNNQSTRAKYAYVNGSVPAIGAGCQYGNNSCGQNHGCVDNQCMNNSGNVNQAKEASRPICPSETATNCRVVKGITQTSGASMNQNLESCIGSGPVNLTVSPMDPRDVGLIVPMGLMVGAHVTPIDHMYFQPIVFHSQPDTYGVYADADGVIEGIGVEPANPDYKYPKIRLVILHTCDFYSIYNLLTSLSPKILSITGPLSAGQEYQKPIRVKAGDLLGKIGGQTLDLSVNYDKINLTGFLVPEHYAGESWKIHTVDPFDYFSEPLRSELLAKDLRQVSPRGGKIDYDVDGRLVGSWFIAGSVGFLGHYVPNSWENHASFAYDEIDPGHIIVSVGNFSSQPMQFSVENNSPDPKDVSVSTGTVKYKLVDTEYVLSNGSNWDHFSYASDISAVSGNKIEGVALVQMMSDRKMKLELFPNQTDANFDNNAITYER